MPTKRLTFEVDEALHSRLKAEAAALGIHLGSHCAALLGEAGPGPSPVEQYDSSTISAMPLGILREMVTEMAEKKPPDWQKQITRVQSEIRRRYRV